MKYPIYIFARDDQSIRIHSDEKSLNHYEQIDVENELYSGWDSDGYPLKVLWIKNVGIKVEQIAAQPQTDVMRKAIFNHIEATAVYYRPDEKFIYDKASNDFVSMFESLKKHIENAPFKQKIKNFFRRF